MKNITYLFGAGASKQALPIVNEIPGRVKKMLDILSSEFSSEFKDDTLPIQKNINKPSNTVFFEFLKDLEWLREVSENSASIDTYAKKLYIKKEDEDLKRLKNIFSAYLTLEQIINKPDPRYDSFFASILDEDKHNFPSNLKVLSWNYDLQFEITYGDYTNDKRIDSSQANLIVSSKYSNVENHSRDKFGIFKINGTASLSSSRGTNKFFYLSEATSKLDKYALKEVLANYYSIFEHHGKVYSDLSFAWEEDSSTKPIDLKIGEACKSTNVVVVVGYSFPFFNRKIDRKIFRCMQSLEKVYFQAPDAENLRERFKSIREDIDDKNLVCIKDTWQFFLPNEL